MGNTVETGEWYLERGMYIQIGTKIKSEWWNIHLIIPGKLRSEYDYKPRREWNKEGQYLPFDKTPESWRKVDGPPEDDPNPRPLDKDERRFIYSAPEVRQLPREASGSGRGV